MVVVGVSSTVPFERDKTFSYPVVEDISGKAKVVLFRERIIDATLRKGDRK